MIVRSILLPISRLIISSITPGKIFARWHLALAITSQSVLPSVDCIGLLVVSVPSHFFCACVSISVWVPDLNEQLSAGHYYCKDISDRQKFPEFCNLSIKSL